MGDDRDTDRAARQARDEALIARLRDDDATALGELMRHYAIRLTAVAAAVSGSDSGAEEIVHDVMLALWDRRTSLDVRSNLSAYLTRATRNRSLNVRRHESSQQRIATNSALQDPDFTRAACNDAEAVLEAADVDARLRVALEHLSPSPREVFLLSWDAGLTYEEIAELLGITVRSVAKQMYRATSRLAECLPRRLL
jgi:RNA polymerase sigma-70 factor (ECF subfamily)